MALELRGDGREIAEINAEANRKRLERARYGGGPVKITDPAAFARVMADMARKAEEQRAAEEQREAERRKREGANYKSKEEREREAREARKQPKGEDEARHLERRFDPSKNYYELLGLDRCASTAEVKRAYKKLALLYHPDKHKAEDAEQQAAIADKFKEVVEAFDTLSDEAQRTVYDKIRDYKEVNPGAGLPVLSPEELAMMRSGAAELRRLRRMGTKTVKHAPLERVVWVSLEKLNCGGMKRVTVARQRVDADGSIIQHTRTFHLILRKGMQEGDRLTFEGEGEEAVDTTPGDLFFVLRQKPHPLFKRTGRADLEMFARALAPGDVHFAVDLTTLQGRHRLLRGSAFATAAAAGGAGGLWRTVVTGQGLWDPQDPWDKPPGDLFVHVRYPGFRLGPGNVRSCLRPRPVYLLGSPADSVAAAMVGGCLASALNHALAAGDLLEEEAAERLGVAEAGEAGQGGSQGPSPPQPLPDRRQRGPSVVCLSVATAGQALEDAAAPAQQAQQAGPWAPSAAAGAVLRVLQKRVPGLRARAVSLPAAPPEAHAAGAGGAGALSGLDAGLVGLLDDEWCSLHEADVIILDISGSPSSRQQQLPTPACPEAGEGAAAAVAGALRWLGASAEGAGLAQALWQGLWRGAHLVGVGGACALLGRHSSGCAPAVLPWYVLRAGGGERGWADLHTAMLGGTGAAADGAAVGVGVMAGSACVVDPCTGAGELLVAPTRDTLVATARWCAHQEEGQGAVEEADEDFGFFYACQRA